jgi:UDP-N-acetylglucosamine 2-epimerase
MKTILNIIGTRPQYIKLVPVVEALKRQDNFNVKTIDTGQHYDEELSAFFIKEFGITIDHTIDTKNKSGCGQLGLMIEQLEVAILKYAPDYILLYGDTNSTLAGAIVAIKLGIPYGHIEAGLRSTLVAGIQEEANRILSDRLADHLFVTDAESQNNLLKEGIGEHKVHLVGDVMYDTFCLMKPHLAEPSDGGKVVVTIHRAENTSSYDVMKKIVSFLVGLSADYHVIAPLHPRTVGALKNFDLMSELEGSVDVIPPVGYLDILNLLNSADFIVSDSGGLPKEAAFLNKRSLLLRADPVWNDYEKAGVFSCADPSAPSFVEDAMNFTKSISSDNSFSFSLQEAGAAEKIVDVIQAYFPD